jgi:hypothetical protein
MPSCEYRLNDTWMPALNKVPGRLPRSRSTIDASTKGKEEERMKWRMESRKKLLTASDAQRSDRVFVKSSRKSTTSTCTLVHREWSVVAAAS